MDQSTSLAEKLLTQPTRKSEGLKKLCNIHGWGDVQRYHEMMDVEADLLLLRESKI
jgi:hypothetical protein